MSSNHVRTNVNQSCPDSCQAIPSGLMSSNHFRTNVKQSHPDSCQTNPLGLMSSNLVRTHIKQSRQDSFIPGSDDDSKNLPLSGPTQTKGKKQNLTSCPDQPGLGGKKQSFTSCPDQPGLGGKFLLLLHSRPDWRQDSHYSLLPHTENLCKGVRGKW